MAFQIKITRARFHVSGYSPQQMVAIGQALISRGIVPRVRAGGTVADSPAPALRPGYARFKERRGVPAIRNWTLTGRTLRSLKVLRASANRAVIGFTDALTNLRAVLNNRRARQFGVSPADRNVVAQEIQAQDSPVSAKAA